MRSRRLQREIDDLVAQGWTIEDESQDRVVMVDRAFGSIASHIVVAVLTVWWTMGIGNALWALYNYVTNSRRRVLWERATACPNCATKIGEDVAYCPSCGLEVDSDTESNSDHDRASASEVVCPECDTVAASGDRFCRVCGTKLAETPGSSTAS